MGRAALLGALVLAFLLGASAQDNLSEQASTNGASGGGGVSGCAGQGDRLFSGSCSAFVGYFQSRADSAIGQSNSAFSVTVSQAPTPSDACCRDARQFTSSGCSCDASLLAQAAQRGVGNNAIRIIARATQFSRCTTSALGGGISSGGC